MSMPMTTAPEAPEEFIGGYRVHPVAAMFPLLEGPAYEMFKSSIKASGLLDPITVQGDTLIDGRNRMRVCVDLGIEPRVQEYDAEIEVYRFIINKNLRRRDLTDDQRSAITTQATLWHRADRARQLQKEAGKEGGRGHKKERAAEPEAPPENLSTKSCEGFLDPAPPAKEPKTRAAHARSTVGQIATEAKVSHHKAAQAVAVAKAAPEELAAVAAGTETLHEAHEKVVKKRAPRKTVVKDSQYYTTRTLSLIRACRKGCSSAKFDVYVNAIRQELKKQCQQ